ncbi:hypothetical protein HYZ82_01075 [Candidatus Nomurabacteria bacterium]|nr:hypothetical protein [Candidatus Nomurabacteria bacterium]
MSMKRNGFFTKIRIFLMIIGLFATPLVSSAQYYYNYPPAGNPLYVTTNNATFVTPNIATLNGTVSGNTSNLSTWFEYGTTPSFGASTSRFNYNYSNTNMSATVGSLSPATIYYFRAVAQNTWGVVYGNTNSFRTDFGGGYVAPTDTYNPYNVQYTSQNTQPAALTAITSTATFIGTRSVELNALILNTPANPSNTWFEWGTNYNLSNQTPIVSVGTLPQIKHISTITELAPGTTYYFRAVAINNTGIRSNGAILSFRTKNVAAAPAPEPATPKDTIEEAKIQPGNLSASAIGSGNFLPDNALEWVILAILIAILVILARNLYVKN